MGGQASKNPLVEAMALYSYGPILKASKNPLVEAVALYSYGPILKASKNPLVEAMETLAIELEKKKAEVASIQLELQNAQKTIALKDELLQTVRPK